MARTRKQVNRFRHNLHIFILKSYVQCISYIIDMSSELESLKQRITELEAELEKKNDENQKLRKELESRIEELEKDRADSDAENIKRDAENAELKVRVAKLEQDSSVVDEQSQDGKVFLLRGFKKGIS